jgi:ergothioneine biosynthesis protein EgtB
VYLNDYRLASRPVTNAEYLEFIEGGGYAEPSLWLSDGWRAACAQDWRAPLYWLEVEGRWHELTLGGCHSLDLAAPVCHLSYYEADAYARWRGCRLPSEAEIEVACAARAVRGNLLETGFLHPRPTNDGEGQWFGDVWEWTASPYGAYPGYRPLAGALGEYNGKFMANQWVLRGGSCVTPRSHLRPTYRNFYYPHDRWPFTGIRLAQDAGG